MKIPRALFCRAYIEAWPLESLNNELRHLTRPLESPAHLDERLGARDFFFGVEELFRDDEVEESALVFERHEEDARFGARSLTADHKPDIIDRCAFGKVDQLIGLGDLAPVEEGTDRFHRMADGAEPEPIVIEEDRLAASVRPKTALAFWAKREPSTRDIHHPADLPERLSAVLPK